MYVVYVSMSICIYVCVCDMHVCFYVLVLKSLHVNFITKNPLDFSAVFIILYRLICSTCLKLNLISPN